MVYVTALLDKDRVDHNKATCGKGQQSLRNTYYIGTYTFKLSEHILLHKLHKQDDHAFTCTI